MTDKLKPCPFCGSELDANDSDTLHPSGSAWLTTGFGWRKYVSSKESINWCYVVNCCTIYGGCGASLNADSKEEAITAWNRRVND